MDVVIKWFMFMRLQSSSVFARSVSSFKRKDIVEIFIPCLINSPCFQWYWTWDKKSGRHLSVMRSVVAVMVFHLGTLALGSLVLAIVRSQRVWSHPLIDQSEAFNTYIRPMRGITHSDGVRVVIVSLEFLHKRLKKMDNSLARWQILSFKNNFLLKSITYFISLFFARNASSLE